ncbi:MAG: sensor histidine kinase [Porcipelethomonas sp.]
MKFLKSKYARMAAFFLSSVMVLVCVFLASGSVIEYQKNEKDIMDGVYLDSEDCVHELSELNGKLWLIGNMYMRNLDENRELSGNEYYKESVRTNLKSAGLMNEDGKIALPETDQFEYTVKFNDIAYSSPGFSGEDENNPYAIIESVGAEDFDAFPLPDMNDCTYYDNGNGMEYYYTNGKGYAVFDYDTSGLESYTDDLGAKIYISKDGTDPVPGYYRDYYEDEEYVQADYQTTLAYMVGYSIYISPVSSVTEEYEQAHAQLDACQETLVRGLLRLIILAAAAIMLMFYVLVTGGYDSSVSGFRLGAADRVWAEIYAVLFAAAGIASVWLAKLTLDSLTDDIIYTMEAKVYISAVAGAAYMIMAACLNSIVKRIKCRKLIETSLIGKLMGFLFRGIKKIYRKARSFIINSEKVKNNIFVRRFMILSLIFTMLGVVDIVFIFQTPEFMIFIPVILGVYIYLNYRNLRTLTGLGEHITRIYGGDYTPVKVEETSTIYGMTEKLNNISDSVEKSVERQLRSERMKIDLITNVSHDLKTPLTSIMSYVDLLSGEKMSPEARDYVKILERKTESLSSIVSDLFDLAKATSRTDINMERLDCAVLVRQVLGDMEDRFTKAGREIRTDIALEKAPITADGKRMYRVLQNLLDNAIKYSLEGTRIYLRLCEEEGRITVSIKNTASYEMKFTPDEITERFVRGDTSRTGEGSGLGLSIAKSFTEACRGEFRIEIENDVFGVYIVFSSEET